MNNKKEIKKFQKICRESAKNLKIWAFKELQQYYSNVVYGDGFIYAKGDDVLLTAHLDTVHEYNPWKIKVEKVKGGFTKISSPQGIGGDDRCGVYMIFNILENTDYRPSILFCEDEEIGGIGSEKFCKTEFIDELKELKFFIELDRANAKDVVFYRCGNIEFQMFVTETTSYDEAHGSFSDISHLSPATDVASVNISCGYYKAHTLEEYVMFEEMLASIEAVKRLLNASIKVDKFDYQEEYSFDYGYGYGYGYGYKYDGYTSSVSDIYGMEFSYYNKEGKEEFDYVDGDSQMECLGAFLYNHPTLCFDDILDMQAYSWDDNVREVGI